MAAFKRFRDVGVIVYANADRDGAAIPRGVEDVRDQAGAKLPRIFVTNADGTRGIRGISFGELTGDMNRVVEQLAE